MTLKRKDFVEAVEVLKNLSRKIENSDDGAQLRDACCWTLMHMQRYYLALRLRKQGVVSNPRSSVNGGSTTPTSGFRDLADSMFEWKWPVIESPNVTRSLPMEAIKQPSTLPFVAQAARDGDIDWIKHHVQTDGSMVRETDSLGRTALMYAIQYDHDDIAKILLDMKSNPNQQAKDGSTACHVACFKGNVPVLMKLHTAGADLGLQDGMGRAPIHWASINQELGCLQYLIKVGVDVNERDKTGASPSMWACREDHIDHFVALSAVENQHIPESDGIERDYNGRTWMHWSVRRDAPLECLQTLLSAETAALKDDDGKTVMHTAAEIGSIDAAKVILEIAGVECMLARDDDDRTALHLAALCGHGEMVDFLLQHGADPAATDKNNSAAWDYAWQNQLHYSLMVMQTFDKQCSKERQGLDRGYSVASTPSVLPEHRLSRQESVGTVRRAAASPATSITPHPPKQPLGQDRSSRRQNSIERKSSVKEKNISQVSQQPDEAYPTPRDQVQDMDVDIPKELRYEPEGEDESASVDMNVSDFEGEEMSPRPAAVVKRSNAKGAQKSYQPHPPKGPPPGGSQNTTIIFEQGTADSSLSVRGKSAAPMPAPRSRALPGAAPPDSSRQPSATPRPPQALMAPPPDRRGGLQPQPLPIDRRPRPPPLPLGQSLEPRFSQPPLKKKRTKSGSGSEKDDEGMTARGYTLHQTAPSALTSARPTPPLKPPMSSSPAPPKKSSDLLPTEKQIQWPVGSSRDKRKVPSPPPKSKSSTSPAPPAGAAAKDPSQWLVGAQRRSVPVWSQAQNPASAKHKHKRSETEQPAQTERSDSGRRRDRSADYAWGSRNSLASGSTERGAGRKAKD